MGVKTWYREYKHFMPICVCAYPPLLIQPLSIVSGSGRRVSETQLCV